MKLCQKATAAVAEASELATTAALTVEESSAPAKVAKKKVAKKKVVKIEKVAKKKVPKEAASAASKDGAADKLTDINGI